MSHKTMIDGVAYEISGGKTLVNGTAYSIDKGKALVGGTVYEVGFAPPVPVITTSSAGYSSNYVDYAYIEFVDAAGKTWHVGSQGQVFDMDASTAAGAPVWVNTFEIPVGTVITCYIKSGGYDKAYIKVNGTQVASETGKDETHYYTVTGDANIKLFTKGSSKTTAYGYIEITET